MGKYYSRKYGHWTPKRKREFWRGVSKLSGQERAGLFDTGDIWPTGPSTYRGERVSEAELEGMRARCPVYPGTCWNCGKAPGGLCGCIHCGREQPVGKWKFSPIFWFPFDPDDAALAFGRIEFVYGNHLVSHAFAYAENDVERRREILAAVLADPNVQREANKSLLEQEVPKLLALWRDKFGFVPQQWAGAGRNSRR